MIYGYARISTKKQSITRQIRNIVEHNAKAEIFEEVYTGTKIEGRKEFNKLLKKVEAGDTIIFDSVSRMSRESKKGIELYLDLFDKGVNLEFIKEPHINTATYRKQIEGANIPSTDNKVVNMILEGVINALKELAKEQIQIAFDQSEKEVKDLSKRTIEGLKTAKDNKKILGRKEGTRLVTKKSIEMKDKIRKMSKSFEGNMKDKEILEILKMDRNTFYKYKKQMLEELQQNN